MIQQPSSNRLLLPAAFFGATIATFKDFPLFSQLNTYLTGAILGALGAALGELLRRATKNYSKTKQCLSYAGAFLLFVGIGIAFPQKTREVDINDYVPQTVKTQFDSIMAASSDRTEAIKNRIINNDHVSFDELTTQQVRDLISCDRCGYWAYVKDSSICFVCYADIMDSSRYSMKDKTGLLKDLQLIQFSIDSDTQEVEFYSPRIQRGYVKDQDWRPSVTDAEVREYSKKFNAQ